jgi:hypothetical protein
MWPTFPLSLCSVLTMLVISHWGSVCSHLPTLVLCSRILVPWRRRRYVPPKCRSTQDLHSATSQKTIFFIETFYLHPHNETLGHNLQAVRILLGFMLLPAGIYHYKLWSVNRSITMQLDIIISDPFIEHQGHTAITVLMLLHTELIYQGHTSTSQQ